MAGKTFQVGDRVRWESRGGTAEGEVIKVATESGCIGDFVYDASGDAPRYIIKTDEGKQAAHHAGVLSHSQPGRS